MLLASAHRRALEVAAELGARTVAFPAISTGIYGFPVERAAPIALREAAGAPDPIDEVRFVLFSDRDLDVYRRAADRSSATSTSRLLARGAAVHVEVAVREEHEAHLLDPVRRAGASRSAIGAARSTGKP